MNFDQVNFNYSVKNIPLPSKYQYLYRLTEQIEKLNKNMRWKAKFFLKENDFIDNTEENKKNKFNFKTKRCPPPIDELKPFENDLWQIPENIKFKPIKCEFQAKLTDDVSKIKSYTELLVQGDKTSNYYKTPTEIHSKTVTKNVTKAYKQAPKTLIKQINNEAKTIATKMNLEDRIHTLTEQPCFLTLKDHKEDYRTNPKYRPHKE